jgi:mercuric ion transport protein
MNNDKMLRTGVIGAGVAALCCFTPVLVIGLGVVGLSAWLGWIDYVLLPALAFFVGLTLYALWRRRRAAACCDAGSAMSDGRS